MDAAQYATLTRQSGLLREMDVVANNIANVSTTGFRREGVVFSEYVARVGGGEDSLSMAAARGRVTDLSPGSVRQTGGMFDMAIEGDGFFLVQTEDGDRLTRAGAFVTGPGGGLVTDQGAAVLVSGRAPIQVPPGEGRVELGIDGLLSRDGRPFAQIGVWQPAEGATLTRAEGAQFAADDVIPADAPRVRQGALEQANVDAVVEIARMIEVQRAYELGQSFLEREDSRLRAMIRAMGQQ